MQHNLWKQLTLGVLVIVMLMQSLTVATTKFTYVDAVAQYIERIEEPGDLLLVAFPYRLVVDEYYHGNLPITDVYMGDDEYSFTERVVRFNWNLQYTTEEMMNEWIAQEVNAKEPKRLFFLSNSESYHWFVGALLQSGWAITDTRETSGIFSATLTILEPHYDRS